ncbi:MAG: FG-GAP repeat protein [Thermoanaerobaculia bacterium]
MPRQPLADTRRSQKGRAASLIFGALILPIALDSLTAPAAAQFGAVGLSAVGARRYGNPSHGFFFPQSGDQFAAALVAGDFNGDGALDLASGSPGHSNVGGDHPGSGVVFVHYALPGVGLAGSQAGQTITQATSGGPDPAEDNDAFGSALAACDFNGDGFDDLAVGIPHESTAGAGFAGAVEVHYGSVSGLAAIAAQFLTQESGTVPGDSEGADFMGAALACGRFNGDSFADLAIGVPDETLYDSTANEQFGAGTVLVLRGSAGGLLTNSATLFDQDVAGMDDTAEYSDYFGTALAVGDFNADGFDDLAIGVPGEDNVFGDGIDAGRGAIQVIFGGSGGLSAIGSFFKVESALGGNSEIGDRMGDALAAGDFDGDGFDDLAIGVPREDVGAVENAGQVIAIYGSASGFPFARTQFWPEDSIHGNGSSETGDLFGSALAAGDFDGDGRDDLAIGHPGEFVLAAEDGQCTVIMGGAGGLSNARRIGFATGFHGLPGTANQANRNFGFAVAAGDFDGDGVSDLAIGAPHEDEAGLTDVGAEIVLYGSLFSDGFEVTNSGFWSASVP